MTSDESRAEFDRGASRTIHVPEGEVGDEAVKAIIPAIHAMARGERNDD